MPLERIRYVSDVGNVRTCLADIMASGSRIGINGAGPRVLQCPVGAVVITVSSCAMATGKCRTITSEASPVFACQYFVQKLITSALLSSFPLSVL